MTLLPDNRWTRAVAPALLLHISIGTVYCWSVFKQLIADELHVSSGTIEWGFSLAIFFLGMSAAFLGPMVEKDIKKSALIATVCFVVGFAGTGASIALHFTPGVFIFYGVIMGIGLGIGYLTPVKNLMLWFSDNKGMATGIAVAGFGLAKAIASPVMEFLIEGVGLVNMFYVLAAVYTVMMLGGFLLIKRPSGYVYEKPSAEYRRGALLKKPLFWGIWIAFYLNITCGLALISQEKDILKDLLHQIPRYASMSSSEFSIAIAGIIGTILAVDALFNALGRVGFATLSDHLKRRESSYKIIFVMSIAVCVLQLLTNSIGNALLWAVLAMLFLINAGYGGGFSTLPVLLDQHFGIKAVSTTHGLTLSAWAIAGLSGNQLASFVVSHASDQAHRYAAVIPVITALYAIALLSIWLVSRVKLPQTAVAKQ
ncbi:OFA family MFS transporter [Bifidobacterium psychraerophilum]|jgi:OFA family oxalate/formate antiporter-like MFS transporter|uniref:OFA family MFS transporter n=1 Tax=Bifidobacterium psychraerophilum TaxID=218140 RepID=UPI0023F32DB4|nr:OFA family MFS transporter [Bifidobacterium psychraerophilum]MCI1659531.1 OFA family MFS transporter [Bifidobacterium psychraerophilum]MCI1804501.1 OFA family MFS transporter [Bifidobacterium psychraerophilum]MCI2176343.1 OFA family MFS transporter [Bifidobacterium psychraerophilum]MCI2181183.1 OFA family MFS transporter [Bifidobacterium psychraerophilum]